MATKVVKKTTPTTVKFKLTGREYRPKAIQNRESWARIQKVLAKGPATEETLHKALQYGDSFIKTLGKDDKGKWPTKWAESHERFLGYMMKGKDSSKHYISRV